jgi:putative DNA primase/helicase
MEASNSPPFKVVKGSTGIGKSRAALEQEISLAKQGDKFVYLTPTVDLADELAQRVGPGVSVRVWRGREQPDPNRPGQKMCQEVDLVEQARRVFADPNRVVCPICPHRSTCGYQKQRAAAASIWFGANNLLFHEMPMAMKGAKLLVIDERFALNDLKGVNGAPILVRIDDLKQQPRHPSSISRTADLLAELMPLRRKLIAALQHHPLGEIERGRLIPVGLTADDCATARKLEWLAKAELPKQATFADLQKAIRKAEGNRDVARRAMLWAALEKLLGNPDAARSGRAEVIEHVDVETGAVQSAVRLYDAPPISKGFAELPTLHFDATANLTLIRARVPHAELTADVVADEAYTRVIQYHSHTFGKQALTSDMDLLVEVWFSAVSQAQLVGGNWLIVMQKAAEEKIRGWYQNTRRTFPPFVELRHHNALAGIDRYRNVRGIIVIGRTLPPPKEVERIAGVLTGFAVERCGDWYPGERITLRAADGSMATVERETHPDPLAAEILRQICDDELLQIIGRGRGANRTAADPLDVVIYGRVPVPVRVDELRIWSPVSLDDELLARQGIVLSSHRDMAEAFGLDPESIKKDRCRKCVQKGTNPYKNLLYRNVPICQLLLGELKAAGYRRDKPRHSNQRVVYDPRIVMDPETWLTERLGPLAVFEPLPALFGTAGAAKNPAPDLRHPPHQTKRERDRARKAARRRTAGAVPRSKYLTQNALSRTKPWEVKGISRRTWERRRARETTAHAFDASPSAGTEAGFFDASPSTAARKEAGPPVASPSAVSPAASFDAGPSAATPVGSHVANPSAAVPVGSAREVPSEVLAATRPDPPPAMAAVPTLLSEPMQLDLFYDYPGNFEREALPDWDGGVAPPAIRLAIDRELRRRSARRGDLAKEIGLSRSQTSNILRGRFGTTPATAHLFKRLLDSWKSAV